MAKAKLKNVAILLLVITNLLLLWMAVPIINQTRTATRTSVTQLQQLFAQYDVDFSQDITPTATTLYMAELSTDQHDVSPAIIAILGDTVYVEDTSTQHQQKYHSPLGVWDISRNGDFLCQLEPGRAVQDMVADTTQILTDMGILTSSISQPQQMDRGTYCVTATQQLFSVPYLTSHLDFTYKNGVLQTISGNAILGNAQFTRNGDPAISYEDALVAFFASRDTLGWVGTAITDVSQSFSQTDTASASLLRLTPGWTITTDTGDFWVDGIARQVYAQ